MRIPAKVVSAQRVGILTRMRIRRESYENPHCRAIDTDLQGMESGGQTGEKPYKTIFAPFMDHFRPFIRAGGIANRQENQGLDHFPPAGRH